MDIVITGIKFRAIDTKLCDFLCDAGAIIFTDGKAVDVIIKLTANGCVEFLTDERDEVIIRLIKKGKKIAYTFDCADIDSVTFQ